MAGISEARRRPCPWRCGRAGHEDLGSVRIDRGGRDRGLLPALSLASAGPLGAAPPARRCQPGRFRVAAHVCTRAQRAGRTPRRWRLRRQALVWLWAVDGVKPDRWDLIGVGVTLVGMALIAFSPRS